jgi:hypothetical protein
MLSLWKVTKKHIFKKSYVLGAGGNLLVAGHWLDSPIEVVFGLTFLAKHVAFPCKIIRIFFEVRLFTIAVNYIFMLECRLFRKPTKYGINSSIYDWFNSYLKDR